MRYNYEALNYLSFQKFVQALIVKVHRETICLPVQQPDGGRDAFFYHDALERKNFVVFQVKFTKNPTEKSERDVIERLIKYEQNKVDVLINKGATHYYLATNVQGTAHLEQGSIDKVNEKLTNTFGIPSYVWWRDDLDARLDNASDIKWSYPEICRTTDVLQFLLKHPEKKAELEAVRAITAYIANQYGDDRDVKFKQVELKRLITDLFVDIPIGNKGSRRERKGMHGNIKEVREIEQYFAKLEENEEYDSEVDHLLNHGSFAAGFLLNMPFVRGVSRFVLEGAPGQGKSTVTQFLCQVNRLKLLPRHRKELDSIDELHASAATRTPFRVDLRDYAAWVAGRHPYAKAGELIPFEEGQRSLESFLTMQIAWHSGGLNLNQHDLLEFFMRAHSVVVLDGFDEVADILTRESVVEEICAAANRLDAHALSIQLIVTSRPAAFANSPGFPEDDWIHLELNDLKWSNIIEYEEKWSKVQDLTTDERIALTATLKEKLRQPHLRDLSRNPMQLAILLQLMHVQGAALPDKRTALYEEYMKIFLNREVEKKQIAGDHRELILSIHGLLAWILQIQAETGKGSGSITKDELRKEVKTYLESEEHDLTLADRLLTGTVERVGALVSRVQGTFEFEVQPLREYFAARHLHKTAPYSPPGNARKGTRPDRFSALASSFYWTNVTRFFCGFYDVGELPSLVDGLIEIGEKSGYKLINQPRHLAMMLLGDYVFTQSPKSMRRLIDFITSEPDFQRLTGADSIHNLRGMELPETAGGKLLYEVCKSKLQEEDPNLRPVLRQVMARNANRNTLKAFWKKLQDEGKLESNPLAEARDFDLVGKFEASEIAELTAGNLKAQVQWLAEANLHDHIVRDAGLYSEARRAFFECEITFLSHRRNQNDSMNILNYLTELLHPHVLAEVFTIPPEHSAVYGRRDYLKRDFVKYAATLSEKVERDPFEALTKIVVELMEIPPEEWRTDLSPWEKLVDTGFQMAPRARLFSLIAMISTAVSDKLAQSRDIQESSDEQSEGGLLNSVKVKGRWQKDGFAPTRELVKRLYFARCDAGNYIWWRGKLDESDKDTRIILLSTLLCWGTPSVIREILNEVGTALEELDGKSWSWFWNLFTLAVAAAGPQVVHLNADRFLEEDASPTERLAIALVIRMSEDANRRAFVRRCFISYGGSDWRILQTAAESELRPEPHEDVDWAFVQRLSEQARMNGIQYLFSHSHVRQHVGVPIDIVQCVLENCDRHNSQFVSLCERTFGVHVAQEAPKVSAVAEKELWFANETKK